MPDATLIHDLVELLRPVLNTQRQRQNALDLLFMGEPRRPDIDLEGAPDETVRHLVITLLRFGALHNGRLAIAALLEQARQEYGYDKQPIIDSLIVRVQAAGPQTASAPKTTALSQTPVFPQTASSPQPSAASQQPASSQSTSNSSENPPDPAPPTRQTLINILLALVIIGIFVFWMFACSGRTEDIAAVLDLSWKVVVGTIVLFGAREVFNRFTGRRVLPFLKTRWFTVILLVLIAGAALLLFRPGACPGLAAAETPSTTPTSTAEPASAMSPSPASEVLATTAPIMLRFVWTAEQMTLRLPNGADKNAVAELVFVYPDLTGVERKTSLVDLFSADQLAHLNTIDCLRIVVANTARPSLIPQCESTRTQEAKNQPESPFWVRRFAVSNGNDASFNCDGTVSTECVGEYRP